MHARKHAVGKLGLEVECLGGVGVGAHEGLEQRGGAVEVEGAVGEAHLGDEGPCVGPMAAEAPRAGGCTVLVGCGVA